MFFYCSFVRWTNYFYIFPAGRGRFLHGLQTNVVSNGYLQLIAIYYYVRHEFTEQNVNCIYLSILFAINLSNDPRRPRGRKENKNSAEARAFDMSGFRDIRIFNKYIQ